MSMTRATSAGFFAARVTVAPLARSAPFAPAAIHSRTNFLFASDTLLSVFGIWSASSFCHNRLSAGVPGTTAGPPLPPFRTAGRVRRSRPFFW